MKNYIIYYRVSSKSQGNSGLGLDAQKAAAKNFLISRGITEEMTSFTEVESGKKANRKELRKAINKCKDTGATLLIAKLDRLSRDIVFIFTLRDELREAGVEFQALDIPDANTLTLGIFATTAQHERETISARTKAGLNSIKEIIKRDGYYIAKKTGRKIDKLGSPDFEKTAMKGALASSAARRKRKIGDRNFRQTFELARLLEDKGMMRKDIAVRLNKSGYKTPTGCEFMGATVSRLLREGKKLLG
jgi:DNA invertase Pin-like site-specific DNA recombinase